MSKNKLISIILPVYNEANNLRWHYDLITNFVSSHNIFYEILYIDDGSTDKSLEIIKEIIKEDPSARYISLSRNFGKEAAISAGLSKCKGDAAIFMDSDGQFPLNVAQIFIDKWLEGYDVVVGVRQNNKGEGFIKHYGSTIFYKILNILTNDKTVPCSTDYRLIDRKVIDEFNKLTERTRITRGLIDWLGFKREYVNFDANVRKSGKASYGYRKLLKLAIDAFVSNSTKPLKIVGVIGVVVTLLSGLTGSVLIIETYAFHDTLNLAVTGSAILAIFLGFLIGIVLSCQGLLALYIESIHNETQNRPLYIIADEN